MKRLPNSIRATFAPLRHRDFRLYFFGYLFYRIGAEMQVVAVIWHLYRLTGSAVSLGMVGLARFIPIVIIAIPAGLAADLYSRKRMLLTSQVIMLSASVLLFLLTINGQVTPLMIYLLIATLSVATTIDTPARQSIVPYLVPKDLFSRSVSLNTILWQSAVVIGPALAGFLLGYGGVAAAYAVTLGCFFIGITALFFIHLPVRLLEKPSGFSFRSLGEGFRFVFRTPIILTGSLLDFFATFFASATVLLPIFAMEILQVGPTQLGFLYASASLGSICAGLCVSLIDKRGQRGKTLIGAVLLYGVATIGFGLSRTFPLAFFFLFFAGVGDVVSTIIRNTIRQTVTPDHLRGRMVSVNMLFFMGGPQLGEVEAGISAAALGTPLSVILGGVGTIIAALIIAWQSKTLRQYE